MTYTRKTTITTVTTTTKKTVTAESIHSQPKRKPASKTAVVHHRSIGQGQGQGPGQGKTVSPPTPDESGKRVLSDLDTGCIVCGSSDCNGDSQKCLHKDGGKGRCYCCASTQHGYGDCTTKSAVYKILQERPFCEICYDFGPKHQIYSQCLRGKRIRRLMSWYFDSQHPGPFAADSERDAAYSAFLKRHLVDQQTFYKFLTAAAKQLEG